MPKYVALNLGHRTIQAVLKRQDGKIPNEIKTKKQVDSVLKFGFRMLMW